MGEWGSQIGCHWLEANSRLFNTQLQRQLAKLIGTLTRPHKFALQREEL